MKNLVQSVALGVMLAASSSLAFASSISGSITIDGGTAAFVPATITPTSSNINFKPADEITLGSGSGTFSSVSSFSPVTFASTFTYTVGTPMAGELLFTFNYLGAPDNFTVSSVSTATNGALYFYGNLSDGASASYVLTPNASGDGSFASTLSIPAISATPEPSSLLLLGTGLIGAAGLVVRKRRTRRA